MANRPNVDRWFSELWGKHNEGIIDEMVDPECVIHGLPNAQRGPAGFRGFYTMFSDAFPKVDIQVDEAIEDRDRVAFRCTAKVTDHAGKEHVLTGGGIARFRDGRFVEAWNQWDFLSLLGSLGHVPPPAFAEAMKKETARAKKPA